MHRILSALIMAAAPFTAHAAGPQEDSSPLSHAASSDHHAATTEISVVVLDAAGAPVEGAVVVTSAGGQGVTDHTGAARFNIALDPAAETLHITAAASIRGANHMGAVRLDTRSSTTSIDAGAITLAAGAGCKPEWLPTFGGGVDTNNSINALTVFDDGSGPALYAGGNFTIAGGVSASRIAKWDGVSWSALGSGMSDTFDNAVVAAMTVFDDGSGPALYAAGRFSVAGGVLASCIARWDGASWSPLGIGMNNLITSLAIFDDGRGPALYAGGYFTTAGGMTVNHIARWNGASWSHVGFGVSSAVRALTVFDDGTGPALYAGGVFTTAGGVSANRIAKWDGAFWSPLGSGMNSTVLALTVFDDGAGPALHAGGDFTSAGGITANHIARWDGVSWSPLGSGMNNQVRTLTVFDDGAGPALYAAGIFTSAGDTSVNRIAKWSAESWSPLESEITGAHGYFSISGLTVFDDGAGSALYVGGSLLGIGDPTATHITRWDGDSWSSVGRGINSAVNALTVFDDGSGAGPALYVAGAFTTAGGVPANRIAKWDGASWSPLGSGINGVVRALKVFDDGSGAGPALYAAGAFSTAGGVSANRIAKWDGVSWSPLGSGVGGVSFPDVTALRVFDDGSGAALYAGGAFTTAGDAAANNIAKWDGESWSPLGGGLDNTVNALTVFDDGDGPSLYAGGGFTSAGGVSANRIARWNGDTWSPLGSGIIGGNPFTTVVHALTIFDDGAGPALFAGGGFTSAGGVSANRIAKWDGDSWSPLGSGVSGGYVSVFALTVFDDGAGPALYAGGSFTTAGGVAANYIAIWDGASWSTLDSGLRYGGEDLSFRNNDPGWVSALTVYDDGAGGGHTLYAGGGFKTSPGGDAYIARLQGCPIPIPGDLNGDGIVGHTDLAILLGSWGPCPPGPAACVADMNGDNIVNAQDLGLLLGFWGATRSQ